MEINGIILLNKEKGISSNKLVNKVKYLLGANKAGHLGTLDVLAEGLLPITLGKGTKLFNYYLNKRKQYITTFKFGYTTDTLDLEGKKTYYNDIKLYKKDIIKVIPNFIGKMKQVPPIYSAKKIAGKKAYSLARKSQIKENDLTAKEIEIYNISLLKCLGKNTFQFLVDCSSGTYIRSLCRDMANKLNTFGVMLNIIRTKCGDFKIENSYSLEEISKGKFEIINLDSLFSYDSINLEEDSNKLLNGQTIKINHCDGIYKCFHNDVFIGLIEIINKTAKLKLRLI